MEDSVKDRDTYESPQDDVATQPETAPAADQPASTVEADTRPFEQRTRDELRLAAKERNIKGRGSMNKAELIEALSK